jgi:hypothetical protein
VIFCIELKLEIFFVEDDIQVAKTGVIVDFRDLSLRLCGCA